MKISKDKKIITIELDDDWSADNVYSALQRQQWISCKKDNFQIFQNGEEPTLDDLSIIASGTTFEMFQENCTLKNVYTPTGYTEKDAKWFSPSIYIQSIYGYSGDYSHKCEMLLNAGFECLRSIKHKKYNEYKNGNGVGKSRDVCWEMWYLPGKWCAKGYLKGKSTEDIINWICEYIKPGTIDCDGKHYALSSPD